MRFSRSTKLLLVVPTSVFVATVAFQWLTALTYGHAPRAGSTIFFAFFAAYVTSFFGVAAATSTINASGGRKTVGEVALICYGLVPHLCLAALIIWLAGWGILSFASST